MDLIAELFKFINKLKINKILRILFNQNNKQNDQHNAMNWKQAQYFENQTNQKKQATGLQLNQSMKNHGDSDVSNTVYIICIASHLTLLFLVTIWKRAA